jgi:hypothetical protein
MPDSPLPSRRAFWKTVAVVGLSSRVRAPPAASPSAAALRPIAGQPVLAVAFLKQPVRVASVKLLRNGRIFLVRVRSTDGVEAGTVSHPSRRALRFPICLRQVAPFFIGQDARDFERLLWERYRHDSN